MLSSTVPPCVVGALWYVTWCRGAKTLQIGTVRRSF
jgi:hypothetical protein